MLTPHVTTSMAVGEWTNSGDSLHAELDRRKVGLDRTMEWGKLEELDRKLKDKLRSRDGRGTAGEIKVISERISYGLGRRAAHCLCVQMGEGSRLVEHTALLLAG